MYVLTYYHFTRRLNTDEIGPRRSKLCTDTKLVYIDDETPVWNDRLYTRYTSVIDALAGYSNTIG